MVGPVCAVCGRRISVREVRLGQRHLCPGCRADMEQARQSQVAMMPPPEASEPSMVRRRRPWWESSEQTVIVKYTKPEEFQADASVAGELGWRAVAADSHDGRAVGAIGTQALLIALRTLGALEVAWERSPAPEFSDIDTDDPVETLRRLKEMLELDLIAEDDYEEKKAEVLARM